MMRSLHNQTMNLELKSKSFFNDVFPVHIWDILNTNNEWYEVTGDLLAILDNIKKYHLDFIKKPIFKIINKEIVTENLNELKNFFSLCNVFDIHRNFLLFLERLEVKGSLPYSLNIEIRQTYYDRFSNSKTS